MSDHDTGNTEDGVTLVAEFDQIRAQVRDEFEWMIKTMTGPGSNHPEHDGCSFIASFVGRLADIVERPELIHEPPNSVIKLIVRLALLGLETEVVRYAAADDQGGEKTQEEGPTS